MVRPPGVLTRFNRVLDGLNCDIPRGSVTGLLGPSGSGKTTLMRAIVGVQRVKSGTVTVLGEPAGTARLRAQVGYLTQAPSVYADLTVRENARYFASLYRGITKTDADAAVANVGLGDAAGQLVGTLPSRTWASPTRRANSSARCPAVSAPGRRWHAPWSVGRRC